MARAVAGKASTRGKTVENPVGNPVDRTECFCGKDKGIAWNTRHMGCNRGKPNAPRDACAAMPRKQGMYEQKLLVQGFAGVRHELAPPRALWNSSPFRACFASRIRDCTPVENMRMLGLPRKGNPVDKARARGGKTAPCPIGGLERARFAQLGTRPTAGVPAACSWRRMEAFCGYRWFQSGCNGTRVKAPESVGKRMRAGAG